MLKRQQVLRFSNAMGEFDSGKGDGRRTKGFESQHRSASLLDGPMILLDYIVEVSARAYFHCPLAAVFLTKQSQASKGCLIPVYIDLVRPRDSFLGDG